MKKFSKILILLLSIALIAGAVAVIASANAGQDNVIEFYVNGEINADVTTYEQALLTVQKGQEGGADYTVKLLGNLTTTTAWKTNDAACYPIGADAPATEALTDNVKRSVTIDLNGYTLDVSGVDETVFQSQRNYRDVTITGSGNIVVGSQRFLGSLSGAKMSVIGTGYGIRMTNKDGAMPWGFISAGGTGCAFEISNVDMHFTATYTDNTTSKTFIDMGANATATFANCRINIEVTNKRATLDNDSGKTFLHPTEGAFVSTGNGSLYKFYNTAITTSTNGIANGGSGAAATYGGVEDNYSIYMKDSSLRCVASNGTVEWVKSLTGVEGYDKLEDALRTTISTGGGWSDGKGSIYLENSHIGASYRTIYGMDATADSVATDRPIFTLDNSTLEHIDSAHNLAGQKNNMSGQGFFATIVYTNFINGSTIEFNSIGGFTCAGSGTMSSLAGTNYSGPAGEGGGSFLDLDIGTKMDKKVTTNYDVPEGAELVQGADGYWYVADADLKAKIEAELATFETKSDSISGFVRFSGIKATGIKLDGFSGVTTWSMPTQEMLDAGEGYELGLDDGKTVAAEFQPKDGGKYTVTNSPYLNLLGTTYNTGFNTNPSAYKVLTYSIDVKTYESTLPLNFVVVGNTKDDGGTRYVYQGNLIPANGTLGGTTMTPGQWNNITIVMNIGGAGAAGTIYVNGVAFRTFNDGAAKGVKGIRLTYESAKYSFDLGASVSFKNCYSKAYNEYVDGEFNADDYVGTISTGADLYAVGNQTFATVTEALTYANEIGSYVTVIGNASASSATVAAPGYVYTGGNVTLTPASDAISITEIAPGAYYITELKSYNINFVVGENTYTSKVADGFGITVPEMPNPDFKIGEDLYDCIGWSTTFVNYKDYASVADYLLAVKEITTYSEEELRAIIPEADTTYYPVYDVTIVVFTITIGDTVTEYGPLDDFAAAISAAPANAIVKLYSDVTVVNQYNATGTSGQKDQYLRRVLNIDVNGHTLAFATVDYFMYFASGGHLKLYSSVAGGKVTQTYVEEDDTHAIFYVHMVSQMTVGAVNGADGNNLTVEAYSFVGITDTDKDTAGLFIDGGTYIKKANDQNFIVNLSKGTLDAKNATFISEGGPIYYQDKQAKTATPTITNCNFITPDGKDVAVNVAEGQTVNLVNSKVIGVLASAGTITMDDTTVATAYIGNVVAAAEGKVLVYSASTTEIAGKTYAVNVAVAQNADDTTTVIWNDLAGNVILTALIKNGEDKLAFAPAVADYDLNVFKIAHSGEWTEKDGVMTPVAAEKPVGYSALFSWDAIFVNMSLNKSFNINVYVEESYYQYLDEATKALFGAEAIKFYDKEDAKSYYCMTASEIRDANQAFTNVTFSLGLVEGEYTATAVYDVNIAEYLLAAVNLATPATEEAETEEGIDTINTKRIAYFIGKYLNFAYVVFENTDITEEYAEFFAEFVETYAGVVDGVEITYPEITTDYTAIVGKVDIAVDLKSAPEFVIKSTVGGTVKFAGVEYTLVAGEELRVSAYVVDFDRNITITLEDGTKGTYCLGNYVANIMADEESSEDLKALVAAFYDYVLFADNFVK